MPYTPIYTTVEDVCTYLRIDSDEANYNDVLSMLMLAESAINTYCKTSYKDSVSVVSKKFNGNGKSALSLSAPLRELTNVKVYALDGSELQTLQYVQTMPLNPRLGFYRWLELPDGLTFPIGVGNIQVFGKWGLPVGDEGLQDMTLAVNLTVQHLFNLKDFNSLVRMEQAGERKVYYADAATTDVIPMIAMTALTPYVINSVGLDS